MSNNPITIFDQWFTEAKKHDIQECEAVNLATATKDGVPSNRTVLLKEYDEFGFVFFTNLESRKGLELKENPFVSLCFYWKELGKQVRIEGRANQVSDKEATEYFDSRPLQSRIGAHVSQQSRVIKSDFDLVKEVAKKTAEMIGKKVERPAYWSGFRVTPHKIEFWQKGNFRVHRRHLYRLEDGVWEMELLYP
ncbi:MAG: pyridoxamine 5'-phosphate oxidase [Alphaproteobacteria bacterium RIFCSPLOWO2_01_FULL_40_26]|nr:MAG: pyridoxamine 5'-phosphate oxidase [Alphaproteobacteria bacterium RIFCSPHIGHO2_02_FULL_40_34]OFW87872.1 MAG: pyridoxamine 5'-phosphate oxidase [Alphaproteobacteria bacterium RIFCSPHIGHO2_01_FULL_40_8]OFW95055.1 MAG: pyridoxamine 5'-phosphate oxidase [Alphaproteobacteria bacterium RIFCSPLOWO2_01_FULL_40_26]OFX10583.1 MAG: pyridoxamine 5'-phosphate oxidase [Alphaproteobacteria bacterium RIFCSPLOWO2_02_FULL_40_19]OFX12135.1 MAG: pyridoxamine 5'-phosphate oxidase [Alphaproteobacteria bacteri